MEEKRKYKQENEDTGVDIEDVVGDCHIMAV